MKKNDVERENGIDVLKTAGSGSGKRECNCKKAKRIAGVFSVGRDDDGNVFFVKKVMDFILKIISSIFIFIAILVVCPFFSVYAVCCLLTGKEIDIRPTRKHKNKTSDAEKLQDKD